MEQFKMRARSFRVGSALLAPLFMLVTAIIAHGQIDVANPRLEKGQIESKSVAAALPYQVLLPVNYFNSEKRFPVLYLLHGLAGHYTDWISKTNLAQYAQQYD